MSHFLEDLFYIIAFIAVAVIFIYGFITFYKRDKKKAIIAAVVIIVAKLLSCFFGWVHSPAPAPHGQPPMPGEMQPGSAGDHPHHPPIDPNAKQPIIINIIGGHGPQDAATQQQTLEALRQAERELAQPPQKPQNGSPEDAHGAPTAFTTANHSHQMEVNL